jgi:hypothetical protein
VLGELLQPGQRLLVAEGGKGGAGVVAPSRLEKQRDLQRELKAAAVRVGGGGWTSADGQCVDVCCFIATSLSCSWSFSGWVEGQLTVAIQLPCWLA